MKCSSPYKNARKTWNYNQSVTQTSWDWWEDSDLDYKIKIFYYDFKAPKSSKVSVRCYLCKRKSTDRKFL